MEEIKTETLLTIRIQKGILVGVTCPHANCGSVSYFNTTHDGFGKKACEQRNGIVNCPGYILEENDVLYNKSTNIM